MLYIKHYTAFSLLKSHHQIHDNIVKLKSILYYTLFIQNVYKVLGTPKSLISLLISLAKP